MVWKRETRGTGGSGRTSTEVRCFSLSVPERDGEKMGGRAGGWTDGEGPRNRYYREGCI